MKRIAIVITCLILTACGAEVAAESEPPKVTPMPTQIEQEQAAELAADQEAARQAVLAEQEAAKAEHEAVEAMRELWNIEQGGLQDGATLEQMDAVHEIIKALHECETKTNLYVMEYAVRREIEAREEAAEEEAAEEEHAAAAYYGNCRVTFYTHTGNNTASGVYPTAGHTVANGSLPFGTRVLIDGQEYVVEDRGVGGDQFDIFVDTETEAVRRGLYYTEVYLIG